MNNIIDNLNEIGQNLAININFINTLDSPSAGANALKYRDVNTEITSPGEVKGLKD